MIQASDLRSGSAKSRGGRPLSGRNRDLHGYDGPMQFSLAAGANPDSADDGGGAMTTVQVTECGKTGPSNACLDEVSLPRCSLYAITQTHAFVWLSSHLDLLFMPLCSSPSQVLPVMARNADEQAAAGGEDEESSSRAASAKKGKAPAAPGSAGKRAQQHKNGKETKKGMKGSKSANSTLFETSGE